MTLNQLTPYHREKVITRARVWYRENRYAISQLLKKQIEEEIEPPAGSVLFDPSLWERRHWIWFQERLNAQNKQRIV